MTGICAEGSGLWSRKQHDLSRDSANKPDACANSLHTSYHDDAYSALT